MEYRLEYCSVSSVFPEASPVFIFCDRYAASASCVSIAPDMSSHWVTEDPLPQGRVMGNMVIMPNGQLFLVNGANTGAAFLFFCILIQVHGLIEGI
jgi:hypothetical protein